MKPLFESTNWEQLKVDLEVRNVFKRGDLF